MHRWNSKAFRMAMADKAMSMRELREKMRKNWPTGVPFPSQSSMYERMNHGDKPITNLLMLKSVAGILQVPQKALKKKG